MVLAPRRAGGVAGVSPCYRRRSPLIRHYLYVGRGGKRRAGGRHETVASTLFSMATSAATAPIFPDSLGNSQRMCFFFPALSPCFCVASGSVTHTAVLSTRSKLKCFNFECGTRGHIGAARHAERGVLLPRRWVSPLSLRGNTTAQSAHIMGNRHQLQRFYDSAAQRGGGTAVGLMEG